MIALASLAVFAGLSLNLLLQFGLGIQDCGPGAARPGAAVLLQGGARCLTVLLLWCLFFYVLAPLSLGFLAYFAVFPLVFAAGKGLEKGLGRLFSGGSVPGAFRSPADGYDGPGSVALVLTLRLAASFPQAAALSLAFSLGNVLAFFILRAIGRRSSLECVPHVLKGIPLILVSAGLLSLVFGSLEALFFGVLYP